MLRRAFLSSVFVALVMAMVSSASAVDLSTGFVLVDSSGSIIAPSTPNTYNIPLGTDFKVRLQATLTNPYYTDNLREDPALQNIPLGLHLITGDITSNTGGVVSPVAINNPAFTPSRWKGMKPLSPLQTPFTNLLPKDGFLYPAGAGAFNLSRWLEQADELPAFQVGLNGPDDILEGCYNASALGSTLLSYDPSSILIYKEESLAEPSQLKTQYLFYEYHNENLNAGYLGHTPITINVVSNENSSLEVVPEPSSIFLVGVGLCGLAMTARRKLSSKSI